MNIARSSVKIAVASATSTVLNFVGITFFARELGAATLGIYFLFQAVLTIATIPANLGTRMAVEKRISGGGPAERVLGTGIAIKSVLLAVVVVGILVARPYVNQYVGAKLAVFLAVAIVLRETSGLLLDVLKGELRAGETAIVKFAYDAIWLPIGVVLVSLDYGVYGLIYATLVGQTGMALFGYYKISTDIGRPSVEQARSLLHYAKYSIIPELDFYLLNWVDVLILGYFLAQAAVGSYEIAWRVSKPVLLVTTAISMTIFPQISAWDTEGSSDALENLLSNVLTPSLLFVFPAFFGAVLLSEEILGLVFGAEFTTASLALVVLLAGKGPQAIRQIAGKCLYGLDRPDLVTKTAIIDLTANVVLNAILIWQFGIVGAALGTTLALTIGTAHRVHYLTDYTNIPVPYRTLGWCLVSSVGMFAVLWVAKRAVGVTTLYDLLAFVGGGAVVYGLFLAVYAPMRSYMVRQIRNIVPQGQLS